MAPTQRVECGVAECLKFITINSLENIRPQRGEVLNMHFTLFTLEAELEWYGAILSPTTTPSPTLPVTGSGAAQIRGPTPQDFLRGIQMTRLFMRPALTLAQMGTPP